MWFIQRLSFPSVFRLLVSESGNLVLSQVINRFCSRKMDLKKITRREKHNDTSNAHSTSNSHSLKATLTEKLSGHKNSSTTHTTSTTTTPAPNFSLDASRFFDEKFDHQAYIQITLHSNKEEGVRSFYSTLGQAKDLAAADLKHNVYKNYKEFVNISKGIKKVESDILLLRGLLSDLKGLHDQGKPTTTTTSTTSHSLTHANSNELNSNAIASGSSSTTFALMNESHPLYELFKTVEGVSKFMGPLESSTRRTLIHSGPLTELDGSSGTFQSNFLLYLLSDVLLIAMKKRKGLKIKYVAEKAFPFHQLTAVDVRDHRLSPDSTVFKIVDSGIRPFFFKADSVQAKRSWLHLIQQQIEATYSTSSNTRVSTFESTSVTSPSKQARTPPDRHDVSPETQLQQSEQLEELDVLIALQAYDSTFDIIHQLTSHPELPSRIHQLSSSLLRTLKHRPSSILTLRRLIFLNQLDAAKSTYLGGRTLLLKDAIRKLKFQGDIPSYLHDVTYLTTQSFQITCDQFHEAFQEYPHVYSFLTEWCTSHMLQLIKTLIKQMGDDPSLTVFSDCVSVMVPHLEHLTLVGFDFMFLFWETVAPHLQRVLESIQFKYTEQLCKSVLEDPFDHIENAYQQGLSISAVDCCKCIDSFLEETNFFHPYPACHSKLESSIREVFEGYHRRLSQALRDRNLSDVQRSVAQFNLRYLSTEYTLPFPWCTPSPSSPSSSLSLWPFDFSRLNQPYLDDLVDSLVPSQKMHHFLKTYPHDQLESLLQRAFYAPLPVPIAVGALTQLVLDLHYLLKHTHPLSNQVASLAQGLCERVFKLYLQNGGAPGLLKDGKWYEQRAMEMEKH